MSEHSPKPTLEKFVKPPKRQRQLESKAAVKLRALKRKLSTIHKHTQKLIDDTLEQLVA